MAERRGSKGVVLGACVGLAVAALTWAAPAAAHISLENGGTHKSRYGDAELKAGPCGRANGARGTNVYTYAPGQVITVKLVETIGHPSYFRFAFDNDGDDAFMEPRTIYPIDAARKCPISTADKCGSSDFYNNTAVLPGMDNLDAHCGPAPGCSAINADAGVADGGTLVTPTGKTYSWNVKLPDVECTNCTLQVIQVMEDDFAHGPYDPTPGVGIEDIYHQCIDIVLKRADDAGATDGGGKSDASSGGSGGATGGTTTTTGTGGATTGTGGATTGTGGATTTTGTGGATTGTGGATGTTTTGTGGTATTGGSGGTGTGGSGGGSAGATTGTSTGTAGSGAAGSTSGSGGDDGGCSVSRGPFRTTAVLAGWSLLALALVSRRRRR